MLAGIGSLVINPDGSYEFTPALNYDGAVPAATYALSDGNGGTDTAVLAITVTPVNDAPDIVDDRATGNEDTTITGNVLDNDSDPDGDPLVVTDFSVDGDSSVYRPGETASIPDVGTITMEANGDFTFVPAPDYDGPVPDVVYTASDGNGGSGQATLHITINPVDDFVPIPDDNTPEVPVMPDMIEAIEAHGAVLDAVEGLNGLSRITDLAGRPHDTPIRLALKPFLGGSSAIVLDLPGSGIDRIRVEAIKHTGIIYLQLVEETENGEKPSVINFRLHGVNDAPAWAWLKQIGPQTFAGYPDIGGDTADIILSIVQRDGRISDHNLRLDSLSGHLSQPKPEDHSFNDRLAPMFSQQMHGDVGKQDIESLEKALGFR